MASGHRSLLQLAPCHPSRCCPDASTPKSASPFQVSPVNPLALLVSRRSRLPGCSPLLLHPRRFLRHEAGRRHVDTSDHFCPDRDCRYGGWLGLGNITSNGHPSGGPWRQLHCTGCGGYFQETHGTPLHGKRVAPDLLVWAVGALAEGLGIRAVARVFEVDPNTVLQWLVEVA